MLNPLLVVVVMDEITKEAREGSVKELLYSDDLVLPGHSWEEIEKKFARWKKVMTEKDLFVNVKKTKAFVLARTVAVYASKFLCSVCRREV